MLFIKTKNLRMYFECETLEELEKHYLNRFQELVNTDITAERGDEIMEEINSQYKRDLKILKARNKCLRRPKVEKPSQFEEMRKAQAKKESANTNAVITRPVAVMMTPPEDEQIE